MELLSKNELDYVGNMVLSGSGENDGQTHQAPLAQPVPARSFLTLAGLLADYADNQCWHNLNEYYAILESGAAETDDQLRSYIYTHRDMFLHIIASYKEAEGVG